MNVKLTQLELPEKKMLVKRDGTEDIMTQGGLFLAQETSPAPTGIITVVGPDCTKYKVGDRIYFHTSSGLSINLYEKVYLLMEEHQALFKINNDEQKEAE